MDPILDEILRIRRGEAVRPDVMRRWQTHIRETLIPRLADLEAVREKAQAGKKGKTAEAVPA